MVWYTAAVAAWLGVVALTAYARSRRPDTLHYDDPEGDSLAIWETRCRLSYEASVERRHGGHGWWPRDGE